MDTPATLLCLHALGASGRSFDRLAAALGADADVLAPDLPGFGDAAAAPGTTVQELVDAAARALAARPADGPWVVLGHSLGGKVATALAAGLATVDVPRPAAVVLLAGSPPVPEPMAPERRERMLSWVADGPLDAAAAREFLDANLGGPLGAADDERAVADLLRTSPRAWRAWLEGGSREDLSARVGTLDVPALVAAGGADGDLGPDAQRELNGAVYPRATFPVLPGAGHLLPLERPREVAAAVGTFLRGLPPAP